MAIIGQITLNGLEDHEMTILYQEKEKHPFLVLNPQVMQMINQPGNVPKQTYNNVQIVWQQGDGLAAIIELLRRLSGKKK
jgi:hypothetical protein